MLYLSFQFVSLYRIPSFFGNDYSYSRLLTGFSKVYYKMQRNKFYIIFKDPFKLLSFMNSTHSDYTVSLFLPFALLLFNIFLPSDVLILFLKPCFLFLFIPCGYIFFIHLKNLNYYSFYFIITQL